MDKKVTKTGNLRNGHIINEMARVGFMDDMDVVVYTDDPGYIPHVHIIDNATRGQEFDACVMIEDNRYFSHGNHTDVFNSKQRKSFDNFMHEPCRSPKYKNNYELAISMWNLNNSDAYVIPKTDNNGETIIPNYTTIKPYKPNNSNNEEQLEESVFNKMNKELLCKLVKEKVDSVINEMFKNSNVI